MKKTTITKLPIAYNKNYIMTINRVFDSDITVSIDGRKYYISIPKNSSWIDVDIYDGMECIVQKEKYYSGRKAYAKLNFIDSYEDTYYEKENNYKETTTYNSSTKYYEILECSIDDTLVTIKHNYRRLIRAYHYDTLASKDLPADMLEYAQNKAKLINEAYDVLKSK